MAKLSYLVALLLEIAGGTFIFLFIISLLALSIFEPLM